MINNIISDKNFLSNFCFIVKKIPNMKIIFLNQNLDVIFSVGDNEAFIADKICNGINIISFFPNNLRIELKQRLQICDKQNCILNFQLKNQWYEVKIIKFLNSTNTIEYILISQNITYQKKISGENQMINFDFYTIFEKLTIGVALFNDKGELISYNPYFENLFELSSTQLKKLFSSEKLDSIIKTDGSKFLKNEFIATKAFKENKTLIKERFGFIKPNNSISWIESSAYPISLFNDLILILFVDITTEVDQQKKNKYKQILDNLLYTLSKHFIKVSYDKWDNSLKFTLSQVSELLGFDKYLFIQKSKNHDSFSIQIEWNRDNVNDTEKLKNNINFKELQYLNSLLKQQKYSIINSNDLPDYATYEKKLFSKFGISTMICFPVISNNTIAYNLIYINTIKSKVFSNDELNFLLSVSDLISIVLQKLSTEKTLMDSNTSLSQANQNKTNFLLNTSHELRTQINSIIGFLQILKKGNNDLERDSEIINYLETSALKMYQTIKNVTEISKIEITQYNLQINYFTIRALIELLSKEIDSKDFLKKSEVNIYSELELNKLIFSDLKLILKSIVYILNFYLLNFNSNNIKIKILSKYDKIRVVIENSYVQINQRLLKSLSKTFITPENKEAYQAESFFSLQVTNKIINELKGELYSYSNEKYGSVFWFNIPENINSIKSVFLNKLIKPKNLTVNIGIISSKLLIFKKIFKIITKLNINFHFIDSLEKLKSYEQNFINLYIIDISLLKEDINNFLLNKDINNAQTVLIVEDDFKKEELNKNFKYFINYQLSTDSFLCLISNILRIDWEVYDTEYNKKNYKNIIFDTLDDLPLKSELLYLDYLISSQQYDLMIVEFYMLEAYFNSKFWEIFNKALNCLDFIFIEKLIKYGLKNVQ